jgi:hypothetical protein
MHSDWLKIIIATYSFLIGSKVLLSFCSMMELNLSSIMELYKKYLSMLNII